MLSCTQLFCTVNEAPKWIKHLKLPPLIPHRSTSQWLIHQCDSLEAAALLKAPLRAL